MLEWRKETDEWQGFLEAPSGVHNMFQLSGGQDIYNKIHRICKKKNFAITFLVKQPAAR
jgi:hypothetical protein